MSPIFQILLYFILCFYRSRANFNSSILNETSCIVFQSLLFDNSISPGNKLPFHNKPHLFLKNNKLFFYVECPHIQKKPCEPKIFSLPVLNKIDNPLNLSELNYTHKSEIDKKKGIIVNSDSATNLLYKFTSEGILYALLEKKNNSDFYWKSIAETNEKNPKFREDASFLFIEIKGKPFLLLAGGVNDIDFFEDIWLFDLESKKWIKAQGIFPKLKGHTMISINDSDQINGIKMIIFGGNLNGKTSNSLFFCDLFFQEQNILFTSEEVFPIKSSLTPNAREGHIAFMKDQRMIIYGGCNYEQQKCFSDVFALDLTNAPLYQWKLLSPAHNSQIPISREGSAFIDLNNEILVLNGCNELGICFNDAYFMKLYHKCLGSCPENAVLYQGKCQCNPGFFGNFCNETGKICPFNCYSNGNCLQNGTCKCYENYFGLYCEYEYCKDSCNNIGFCDKKQMKCICERGFFGINCKGNCVKNCNENGYCYDGKCECFDQYKGEHCETRIGFGGCWSFNDFIEGNNQQACFSFDYEREKRIKGFMHLDNQGLLFKEAAVYNKESIYEEIKSIISSKISSENLADVIIEGKIYRYDLEKNAFVYGMLGYLSISSDHHFLTMKVLNLSENTSQIYQGSRQNQCNNNKDCFGNGYCDSSHKCRCLLNATGTYCQFMNKNINYFKEPKCTSNCNNNGKCNEKDGSCLCFPGFNGTFCENVLCPKNCSIQRLESNQEIVVKSGICDRKQGKCQCFPGYAGEACEKPSFCDDNCTSPTQGKCIYTDTGPKCQCYEGFFGEKCEKKYCPLNCSLNGKCDEKNGECICGDKYSGVSCEKYKECAYNCLGNGRCFEGGCLCYEGYEGSFCELQVSCPRKCNGKGQCIWGQCLCDEGYQGKACEKKLKIEQEIEGFRERNKNFMTLKKKKKNGEMKSKKYTYNLKKKIYQKERFLDKNKNVSFAYLDKIVKVNDSSFMNENIMESQIKNADNPAIKFKEDLLLIFIMVIIGILIIFLLNNQKIKFRKK